MIFHQKIVYDIWRSTHRRPPGVIMSQPRRSSPNHALAVLVVAAATLAAGSATNGRGA